MDPFDADLTIKRSKLSDEVLSRLLDMIRDGRLKPGDRLPSERHLAQAFEVSRASLRDAIRQLEILGYLEVRQGDGTLVRHPDGATLSQPFRSLLTGHPHLAADLLEFRRLLEPQMAALAAERCTPEAADRLEASLDVQRRRLQEDLPLTALDLEFHHLVATIAGNVTLLHVVGTLQSLLEDLRNEHLTRSKPRLAVLQHTVIARAIAAGDAGRAFEAMDEHLQAVEDGVFPESPA